MRGTVDIDMVIALKQDSFSRVEAALKSLGLSSRLPITATEAYQFREEYIENRNLIAWSFCNADNPLELVDIILTEDLEKLDTITKKALGLSIHVVSISALICPKKKSARPQDLEDIDALQKLL